MYVPIDIYRAQGQIEGFLSRLGHRDGARPQINLISVGSPKGARWGFRASEAHSDTRWAPGI